MVAKRDTLYVPLHPPTDRDTRLHLLRSSESYKELERLLKLAGINMSVDKVLALAQIIVTIQMTLPFNKQTISEPC